MHAGSSHLHTSTISREGVQISVQAKQKTVAPTSRPNKTNCDLSFNTRSHRYKTDTHSKVYALVWTIANKKVVQTQQFLTKTSKTKGGQRGKWNQTDKMHTPPISAHIPKLASPIPQHRHFVRNAYTSPPLTPCIVTNTTLLSQQTRLARNKKQGKELFLVAKKGKFVTLDRDFLI